MKVEASKNNKDLAWQGYNTWKVNCSCVYSAYILKPVLSSLGGICKHE